MRAATFVSLLLATASPVITINTAVAQTQSPTKIASTVLVTVNGQQLTQGMVNSVIEVGEFLADHKFSQAEKSWFRDAAIKDFRQNPTDEIRGYRNVEKILSAIRKDSQNPVNLAYGRAKLMTDIYLQLLAKNEVNKPSIMTIVYKYSPVLFADPRNNFVVTKRTIDSLYASNNFVAQLAGKPTQTPNYQGIAQYLHQNYYKNLSAQQKKSLAIAESRWVILQQQWSKASPQTRQNVSVFINKHLQRGIKISSIARYLEDSVTGENTKSANGFDNPALYPIATELGRQKNVILQDTLDFYNGATMWGE
jgi:hypothetical protein